MPAVQAYNHMTHEVVDADEAVEETTPGRFYIKMGFAGYNCPANNGFGFTSVNNAVKAINRYQKATS